MLVFLTAILTASLLGSMHCVGMCGPLAIFASGAGDSLPRRQVMISTTLYHFGRLATYSIAGLIAGLLGSLVDTGGQTLGFQLAAARIVGLAMIVIGVAKIADPLIRRWIPARPSRVSRVSGWLIKLRPLIVRLPPSGRAVTIGALTTLLPCGWLYLFALIAAGTGSPLMGVAVMFAFWLGTVPALTALISGTVALSSRFRSAVPTAAAVLLIGAGFFTASGRGFADLASLDEIQYAAKMDESSTTQEILDAPLPCCEPLGKRSSHENSIDPGLIDDPNQE